MADLNYRQLTPISRNWGYDRGLPIDRYYIEHFLRMSRADVYGRVLEIQGDRYATKLGRTRITHLDILDLSSHNPHATIVADLASVDGLPADTFDSIICTQTLQFIYECRTAAVNLRSMLKSGGVLLATIPGISKVDFKATGYDWHWSFTSVSARRMFEEAFGVGSVNINTFGNVLTSISFLHGLAASDLAVEELEYSDPEYEVVIGIRAIKT